MIAKTTLRKVDIQRYVSREFLDRSFNRSGICAYCSRKFDCCLSHEYGLVFECEDYDPGDDNALSVTFSTLGLSTDEEDYSYLNGLCRECQKRDICQLKDISGGVWHCDEFI
jgi:hypothetical protein